MKTQAQPMPAPPSAAAEPVLEYDRVMLRPTWPYDTALQDVSFTIRPGELVLITLEPGHVRSPFADLTQALRPPHGGEIRLLGQSWQAMKPRDVARNRFHVARVFDVGGWISNLDVIENVLLAQLHYRQGSPEELLGRADELARGFGLTGGIPRKRPAAASQFELRLSQWARALLGEARLLVLERPTKDVRPEAVPPFLEAVGAARRRGTAVLWVTTDGAGPSTSHNITPVDVTARYAVRGTGLERVDVAKTDSIT